MTNIRRWVLAAVVAIAGVGCAPVAPYQRGHLARPDMAPEPSPTAQVLDKTFASKEGASGSGSVGGGGCGCR